MSTFAGKKGIFAVAVIMTACLAMSGCKQKADNQARHGNYDFTDGKVLGVLGTQESEIRLGSSTSKKSSFQSAATTPVAVVTENKTLNEDNAKELPDEVQDMVGLCDALNIASAETGITYCTDPEYVWRAVRGAMLNADPEEEGFRVEDDALVVDSEIVSRYVYTMFGGLKEIPDIPIDLTKVDDEQQYGSAPITVGTDEFYRFSLEDRGGSQPEVKSVISYTDGTKEMKVALTDVSTGKEEVNFIYSLRDNARDTSLSSIFNFEITGQRPSDMLTDMKMKGIPYIEMVKQRYPEDSNDGNEESVNAENSSDDSEGEEERVNRSVEEIPYFCCNREINKGVEELNGRISSEIMEFATAKESEEEWHEICAYPVTTTKYVQVVVTYSRWPDYGTDGNLKTYNYDVTNSCAMGMNEALTLSELKIDELYGEIKDAFVPANDGGEYIKAEYNGFLVRKDGSVDFYVTIYLDNNVAEPYDRLAAYNPKTKELRYIFDSDEGVVSKDLEDEYLPVLTHGKKDGE